MSGPPYAKMRDCDSTYAAVEAIERTDSTVWVYDGVRSDTMGKIGEYLSRIIRKSEYDRKRQYFR
eukprot:1412213-Ditylum_brightwellii.AAC.2